MDNRLSLDFSFHDVPLLSSTRLSCAPDSPTRPGVDCSSTLQTLTVNESKPASFSTAYSMRGVVPDTLTEEDITAVPVSDDDVIADSPQPEKTPLRAAREDSTSDTQSDVTEKENRSPEFFSFREMDDAIQQILRKRGRSKRRKRTPRTLDAILEGDSSVSGRSPPMTSPGKSPSLLSPVKSPVVSPARSLKTRDLNIRSPWKGSPLTALLEVSLSSQQSTEGTASELDVSITDKSLQVSFSSVESCSQPEKLSHSGLSHAEMSHSGLSHAEMSHSGLSHAEMSHSGLSHAEMSHSGLSHAEMSHSGLSHAEMTHSGLSHAEMSHSGLSHAEMSHSGLSHAEMTHSGFSHTEMTHTDLSQSQMPHSDRTHSDATHLYWTQPDKSDAELSEQALTQEDLFPPEAAHAAAGADRRRRSEARRRKSRRVSVLYDVARGEVSEESDNELYTTCIDQSDGEEIHESAEPDSPDSDVIVLTPEPAPPLITIEDTPSSDDDIISRRRTPARTRVISESESEDDDEQFMSFVQKQKTPAPPKSVKFSRKSMARFVISDDSFISEDEDDDEEVDLVGDIHHQVLRSGKKLNTARKISWSSDDDTDTKIRKPLLSDESEDSEQSRDDGSDQSEEEEHVYDGKTPGRVPRKASAVTPDGQMMRRKKQVIPHTTGHRATFTGFLRSLSEDIGQGQRRHPDAVRYINRFNKTTREELTSRLFQLYNETVFQNQLPEDMSVTWNPRLTKTAGLCITRLSSGMQRTAELELSIKVCDRAERVRDTLIHEMCHAACWLVYSVRNGHGRYWQTLARRACIALSDLPPITRCHSYKIETKFIYRCTQCAYQIGRHSRSLDMNAKRCGYCRGQFELLVNSKRGVKVTS